MALSGTRQGFYATRCTVDFHFEHLWSAIFEFASQRLQFGGWFESLDRKRGRFSSRQIRNCAINLDGIGGVSVPLKSRRPCDSRLYPGDLLTSIHQSANGLYAGCND